MEEEYKYIRALLENDYKILNEMYKKFLPKIEAIVLKNNGNKDDAFNIFQEALIIILRKSQQLGFELTSKFSTFLYGICWKLWLKELKKKKINQLINLPDEALSITDLLEELMKEEERYQLLLEKLKELSEKCQEIILLRLKKIKFKDIADTMGYENENTAIQKHFKCKKQLIKLIRGDDRYEDLK